VEELALAKKKSGGGNPVEVPSQGFRKERKGTDRGILIYHLKRGRTLLSGKEGFSLGG